MSPLAVCSHATYIFATVLQRTLSDICVRCSRRGYHRHPSRRYFQSLCGAPFLVQGAIRNSSHHFCWATRPGPRLRKVQAILANIVPNGGLQGRLLPTRWPSTSSPVSAMVPTFLPQLVFLNEPDGHLEAH